jgi:PAS domain S-box-containing protein
MFLRTSAPEIYAAGDVAQYPDPITSWNKSAERLFSYTAEEAIGKPMTMLIPPDRLEEEVQLLRRSVSR